LLGVAPDADQRAIKSAYRRLARDHHPDLNPGDPQAEERFKQILAAFHVLSDSNKRRRYDEYGFEGLRSDFDPRSAKRRSRRGQKRRAEPSADEIFAEIFGGRSPLDTSHLRDFGGFDTSLEQGQHIDADITVDLVTAVTGGSTRVRLPNRTIEIDVPEGAIDGDTLQLRGEGGEPASPTGIPGDLTIRVHVEPHPLLRRDGLDLYLDLPVTIAEAINGADILVPTPRGDLEVTIPSGVHTGTKLRLGAQGVRRGGNAGDFFVVVHVHTPDYVDDEIREAAEEIERGYSVDVRRKLEL
jgi:curved DNA-binding protein